MYVYSLWIKPTRLNPPTRCLKDCKGYLPKDLHFKEEWGSVTETSLVRRTNTGSSVFKGRFYLSNKGLEWERNPFRREKKERRGKCFSDLSQHRTTFPPHPSVWGERKCQALLPLKQLSCSLFVVLGIRTRIHGWCTIIYCEIINLKNLSPIWNTSCVRLGWNQ